jgi:hypothetical protein
MNYVSKVKGQILRKPEHWHPSLSIPIGLSNWSSIWPWKMLYDFIMKVPVSKSKYILEFSRERDEQEAETITLS